MDLDSVQFYPSIKCIAFINNIYLFTLGLDGLVDVPTVCECEFDNCIVRSGARINGPGCSNVAPLHMTQCMVRVWLSMCILKRCMCN